MWSSTPRAIASNSSARDVRESKPISAVSAMRRHIEAAARAERMGLSVHRQSSRASGHAPMATAHRKTSNDRTPIARRSLARSARCRGEKVTAYAGRSEDTNGTTCSSYSARCAAGVSVRRVRGRLRSLASSGEGTRLGGPLA